MRPAHAFQGDAPPLATLAVRAFPPVAGLLVKTAPALEPRADLVALLARLRRLGVIAVAALALRIRGEPRGDDWRLRVGRSAGSKHEAERGPRERESHGHPPHPPPARRLSARGAQTIVVRPHAARIRAAGAAAQAPEIAPPAILAKSATLLPAIPGFAGLRRQGRMPPFLHACHLVRRRPPRGSYHVPLIRGGA